MAQTRTTCPRCRQPVIAEVEQIFDLNSDPQAKQKLLSGQFNYIHCPNCGYEGALSTPIVYHDPEKELLLTYFPPEMGLPVNEQERLIGPLITQVVNRLPNEKRKGYLFRPQTMLTLQTMIERVLEADGITKEMLQAQQQRVNLLQRLLSTPQESRAEIIQQEEKLIDETFFGILSRVAEASLAQGDQQTAQQLAALQNDLLTQTSLGREIKSQAQEAEEAIKSLREASQKGLTREKLLDLMITAPTETRLATLVDYAHSGMDYNFFQLLSDKLDKAGGEEKEKLIKLREKLLAMKGEIDLAIQEQLNQTHQLFEKIISAPDVEDATTQNLGAISQLFIEVMNSELDAARKKGDLERSAKIQKIAAVLQKASAPPAEIAFVEELLSAENDAAIQKLMNDNAEKITPEFLQILNSLITQSGDGQQPPELNEKLQSVYRNALRFSMAANLKK